jgi:hypothetical protein
MTGASVHAPRVDCNRRWIDASGPETKTDLQTEERSATALRAPGTKTGHQVEQHLRRHRLPWWVSPPGGDSFEVQVAYEPPG